MPAANTYTQIASTTTSGNATSVTFSSIPATYTDLIIVFNGSASGTSGDLARFNSDTGANYSSTFMRGDGSSAASGRVPSATSINPGLTFGTSQSTYIMQIMNYANTTTYKTALYRSSSVATSSYVGAAVALWRSTAAINTINFFTSGTNYVNGSTFSLYGVTAA
jgi:hypothetical protein